MSKTPDPEVPLDISTKEDEIDDNQNVGQVAEDMILLEVQEDRGPNENGTGNKGKSDEAREEHEGEKRSDEIADKKERRDRDRKDRGRDKGKDRERSSKDKRDGDKDRERSSKDKKDGDKDRDKDKEKDRDKARRRSGGDHKRLRDDDKDRRESKRSHRSKSRDRSNRRDSRDRKSNRRSRSRSRSKRRTRSKDRRRSRSSPKSHRRSSRSRDRQRGRRRRQSDSDSDYGGYVPRKRQEAPQAAGYSTAFVDPYAALRSKGPMPTDPEGIKKQMQEQQLKARQMVLQQQAASAIAAASKTQREIYVGNLVQGLVTEDALKQLFNSTMKAAFPEQQVVGLEPVCSVSMHSEGRYAFVELRTPNMASAALQLSGQVQLLGQNISVGRPSGYVDPSAAQMSAAQAATALQAYEAGQMSLEQATEAMNTISMPGQSASEPPQGSPAGAPPLALPPPPQLPATQVLQVEGMVTADVLADDSEYAEIIEDLEEECGKYGQLLEVKVPRPLNPEQSAQLFGQGDFGKAYVYFKDAAGCQQARSAINGRLFAGETIKADFVSIEKFAEAGT